LRQIVYGYNEKVVIPNRTRIMKKIKMGILSSLLVIASIIHCPEGLAASAIPQPISIAVSRSTEPVLTVMTPGGPRRFSLADLEGTGLYQVTTSTFWPNNDGTYEGPLLSNVLKRSGLADAAAVRISALDGFSQVMPQKDWRQWPVLLATRRDGQPLSISNKGPLRVIYPRDMAPELDDSMYRLRWVWLVNSIEPAATR
jgi:hypothetical protein